MAGFDDVHIGPLRDILGYLGLKDCLAVILTSRTLRNVGKTHIPRCVRNTIDSFRKNDLNVGGLLPKVSWLHMRVTRHLHEEQRIFLANKFLKNKFSAFSDYSRDIGHFILRLSQYRDAGFQTVNLYRNLIINHPCFDSYAYHGLACMSIQKKMLDAHNTLGDLKHRSYEAELAYNISDTRCR